jgi:alpha-tubulin suppressor-like RCC1 family protein
VCSCTAVIIGPNFHVIYRSNVIAPLNPGIVSVRVPSVAEWLQNVALRDLALHENHAACVDARGDVYQWGNGFFGSISNYNRDRKPTIALQGKVQDFPYDI